MTAVEWLAEQMLWNEFHCPYLEEAKQMEENQMIDFALFRYDYLEKQMIYFALFRDHYLEKAEKLEDLTIPNEDLVKLFKQQD